jgi:hypothetical protein
MVIEGEDFLQIETSHRDERCGIDVAKVLVLILLEQGLDYPSAGHVPTTTMARSVFG